MHCLICGNELKGCLCPRCDFDLSRCAERYPTLGPVRGKPTPLYVIRNSYFEELLRLRSQGAKPWVSVPQGVQKAQPSAKTPAPEKSKALPPVHLTLQRRSLAASPYHTAGVRSDGTVAAVGSDNFSVLTKSWTGIAAVAVGFRHIVGLREDGTVLAAGSGAQCRVQDWRNIVSVAAGLFYTAGLREDGTVVVAGALNDRTNQLQKWDHIVAIAGGGHHLAGLRSDGTVVAVGDNNRGQCKVEEWTRVTEIAAGTNHTVARSADGRLLAAGANDWGQCGTADMRGVLHCAAGGSLTLGITGSGQVLTAGALGYVKPAELEQLCQDLAEVAFSGIHIAALHRDGSVSALGDNRDGQCSVTDWRLWVPAGSSTSARSVLSGVSAPPTPIEKARVP